MGETGGSFHSLVAAAENLDGERSSLARDGDTVTDTVTVTVPLQSDTHPYFLDACDLLKGN